jgi:tellurite resistance protein TehA-like permease
VLFIIIYKLFLYKKKKKKRKKQFIEKIIIPTFYIFH